MSHKQRAANRVMVIVIALTVIMMVLFSSLALTAQALPIRPTPEDPTEVPTEEPPAPGTARLPNLGAIELRAAFPETWPWGQRAWDEVWTVVEWQDDGGEWRVVEGWQGTLDEVSQEDGVTGRKTWWVGKPNLGRTPFRWRVYQSRGGLLLATSETFSLPASTHETVRVEIALP
jgi:hypothetical protein